MAQEGGPPDAGGAAGGDAPGTPSSSGDAGGAAAAAAPAGEPAGTPPPSAARPRRHRFVGTYEPRLDEKGRLLLPARVRNDLAAGLMITRGPDNCLLIYPMAEFDRIYEQLSVAPMTGPKLRTHVRMLLSGASEEFPDKQGRFLVPIKLRRYAGIDREVVLIGAGPRLELWDAQTWQRFADEHEAEFAEQNEEVLPGFY